MTRLEEVKKLLTEASSKKMTPSRDAVNDTKMKRWPGKRVKSIKGGDGIFLVDTQAKVEPLVKQMGDGFTEDDVFEDEEFVAYVPYEKDGDKKYFWRRGPEATDLVATVEKEFEKFISRNS